MGLFCVKEQLGILSTMVGALGIFPLGGPFLGGACVVPVCGLFWSQILPQGKLKPET